MKSVDNMVQSILNENHSAIQKAMVRTAGKIQRDFLAQAKIYLDNYYMEYSPVYYDRIDNLKKYSVHRRNSNIQYGDVVEAGIYFSSDSMDAYPRHPNAKPWESRTFATLEDFVLDNAMQGYHGRKGLNDGTPIDEEMQRYVQWYGDTMLDKLINDNIARFLK